uniref:Uncharacterized protein n=1 Tax=Anguilla anguilla TaxID=7936 RepID=A0A0E9WXQ8_ANGAN
MFLVSFENPVLVVLAIASCKAVYAMKRIVKYDMQSLQKPFTITKII